MERDNQSVSNCPEVKCFLLSLGSAIPLVSVYICNSVAIIRSASIATCKYQTVWSQLSDSFFKVLVSKALISH